MSEISLKDLLGKLQEEHADAITKAQEGGPSGQWDADLPLDREYRVTVANCTYGAAKSSGKAQFVFTFEVLEPKEFAGAKFQEYVAENPPNEFASRSMGELFGALGANFNPDSNDKEAFAAEFIDQTAVIAIRKWGQELDRTGVRWANSDRGQSLKTNVKPPKVPVKPQDLRPEINIPKDEPATENPVIVDVAEQQAPAPAQTTSLPGGVNLPPGLRG